ncbi:uncharacterized protein LOC124181695 [Neodiprion fabricii]|uniref:uncharacterized protein LOC124181695 n=1 Tax=Neodiprion fabricii TaxID=2872261 RepID=UPI001ED94296|nr:uncharacterized protein LOC124181695 [Neodiprion fabricii]
MAEPSLDIIYYNMAQSNTKNKIEKQMENEVFEVDPYVRRTSIHRTPPQPRRATTLEVQTKDPAPVQTPLILIDAEAPREAAQKGAFELKGAIPKARREGARTMSCPGEVTTRNVQEVSERESLKDLITLIEGMKAFTVAHKNTHVAHREDVAKAAIIIRRVKRAWNRMEEECAGTRVPRETGDKATQTGAQQLQQKQQEAATTNKRKEISPSTGAAEKRPRPVKQGEKPYQEGWSEVVKRGRRTAAATTPAAPVAPTKNTAAAPAKTDGGKNYADVLKKVRGQVDPDKVGASITAVRRTRGGDVLLELKGSGGAQALKEAVAMALGDRAKVTTLEPAMTIDVRDLDEITTAEETRAALSSALKAPLEGEIRLRSGVRGTQTALMRIPERTARKLLAIGKVKIGWTACRIRERIMVDRAQGEGLQEVQSSVHRLHKWWRKGRPFRRERSVQGFQGRAAEGQGPAEREGHREGVPSSDNAGSKSDRGGADNALPHKPWSDLQTEARFLPEMAGVRGDNAGSGDRPGVVILQVNLNRSRAAQDLLTQTAAAHGAGILIVSEPSGAGTQGNWMVDRRGDAAILATNNIPGTLTLEGRGEGFVWARTSGLTIYSCYFSPNVAPIDFEAQLDRLKASIRTASGRIIVAGDFNAKSPSWGSSKLDPRGQAVVEFLARLDLHPVNEGGAPTWQRVSTGSGSVIDITAGSLEVAAEFQGWRVLEDETLSDHRCIAMRWLPAKPGKPLGKGFDGGWAVHRSDKEAMMTCLRKEKEEQADNPADSEVDRLMNTLTKACDAGVPRRRPPRGRTAAHWWNERIAALRRDCVRARRLAQRARARGGDSQNDQATAYRLAKKALRTEIKATKARCWEKLLQTVDGDP